MRTPSILLTGLAVVAIAGATTLQQLSLDDMVRQSTGIVRAKVTGSHSELRGQNIYTYYHLQILEAAKAPRPETPGQAIEVAVPGGSLNGIRQVAIGAPQLSTGSEYVVFLWTSKSGLTQIIGLSQGLFQTARDASGNIRLTRAASAEPMFDKRGQETSGDPVEMPWSEMRARIRQELGK